MFVRAQLAILILIEDSHELLDRADLGELVEVGLELAEDYLQDLLGEVRSGHLVLGKSYPDCLALGGAVVVGLGLPLHLGDEGRVDGVQRVEALRVELDGRDGVAAGRSNIGHQ